MELDDEDCSDLRLDDEDLGFVVDEDEVEAGLDVDGILIFDVDADRLLLDAEAAVVGLSFSGCWASFGFLCFQEAGFFGVSSSSFRSFLSFPLPPNRFFLETLRFSIDLKSLGFVMVNKVVCVRR